MSMYCSNLQYASKVVSDHRSVSVNYSNLGEFKTLLKQYYSKQRGFSFNLIIKNPQLNRLRCQTAELKGSDWRCIVVELRIKYCGKKILGFI